DGGARPRCRGVRSQRMRGTRIRSSEDEADCGAEGETGLDPEGQAEAETGRAAEVEAEAEQGQAEARGDSAAPSCAPAWSRPAGAVAHERGESRRASAR